MKLTSRIAASFEGLGFRESLLRVLVGGVLVSALGAAAWEGISNLIR